MQGHISRRWRGCRIATCILKVQGAFMFMDSSTHMVLAGIPGALVQGLFLAPDYFLHFSVTCQYFFQLGLRKRIKLLNADDGDIVSIKF